MMRESYDCFGRPVQRRSPEGSQAVRLRLRRSGADAQQGRLWTAHRWNDHNVNGSPFEIEVRETYAYTGDGGRVVHACQTLQPAGREILKDRPD